MSKERRQYTQEFKREAVRLSETGEKSAAQVARDLGIPPQQLYKWRAELRGHGSAAFPGAGQLHADAEVAQLRRELAQVQQERDILKKALAIFSRSALR
jgi:transposase